MFVAGPSAVSVDPALARVATRNPELRAVSIGVTCFYALLVPAHLLVLSGSTSLVMAVVAALSAAAAGWLARRSRPGRPALPAVLVDGLVAVPLVNSLLHLALTRQTEQTTTLALVVVGIGAYVGNRVLAAASAGLAVLAWLALLALVLDPAPGQAMHFGFLMAMACVVGGVLNEARRRRELALVRAGDELAESERRFRTVVDASPAGAGLVDEYGCFVSVNPALCTLLARASEELIGQPLASFTHPEDRDGGAPGPVPTAADGEGRASEQRYLRPDGESRCTRTTVAQVPGPQGQAWQLFHVQDVTERRTAERAQRESEASLLAVARVVRAIHTGEQSRAVIVQAVREVAGTSGVCLLERDEDGGLTVTACDGVRLTGARLGRGDHSASGHVWQTGQALFLADPHRDPRVSAELLEVSGARSTLFQPIAVRGQVRAVLVLTWNQRVAQVPERALAAITMLADETAVALEHDQLLDRLGREAVTDPLTGLPNRRAWDETLVGAMARSRSAGEPLTVAIVDLDHFKAYNDARGHLAGDELLRTFAAAARTALRDVDVLARWGGEEFAVALPDCPGEQAERVLQRVRAAMPDGQSASIGFAVWDGSESAEAAVGRADAAMYRAKLEGRDRVRAADPPAGSAGPAVVERVPRARRHEDVPVLRAG